MLSSPAARKGTFLVLTVGVMLGVCLSALARTLLATDHESAAANIVESMAALAALTSADRLKPTDNNPHQARTNRFVASRFPVRGSKIERSLDELAAKFGASARSDKFTIHDFGPMYEKVLEPYLADASTPFRFLEVGLGCFHTNNFNGGPGYRFIKHYAPHVEYVGVDIMPCNFSHLGAADAAYLADRFVRGSQDDPAVLAAATRRAGGWFDVIVDDGSHMSRHIIATFLNLFQNSLRPGGVYCIEDLSTAYIGMGGHRRSAQAEGSTSVSFIQNLVAQLQFPFHWWADEQQRTMEPFVHPGATFPITKLGAMIRSVDCDREICCITKMDNAPEAKHRFPVPCAEDICAIPSKYIKPDWTLW